MTMLPSTLWESMYSRPSFIQSLVIQKKTKQNIIQKINTTQINRQRQRINQNNQHKLTH